MQKNPVFAAINMENKPEMRLMSVSFSFFKDSSFASYGILCLFFGIVFTALFWQHFWAFTCLLILKIIPTVYFWVFLDACDHKTNSLRSCVHQKILVYILTFWFDCTYVCKVFVCCQTSLVATLNSRHTPIQVFFQVVVQVLKKILRH